ncbi:MAG: cyclic nucleotide-binding domain-containing protein [Burkholderiales bacterium]|nr:cyclic nucleotide-binding domain-containing protein [Burkholderiales bacterium]
MNLTELFKHETDLLQIAEGSFIYEAGDPGDRMYVLMAGEAQIVVGNTVVERATPGSLFGELALVDGSARSASVIAVTDCKVLPIDVKRFQFLVQQTPNFALHVMKVIAERLHNMDKRLLESQES